MPTPWTSEDAEQVICDYLEPLLGVPVGVKAAAANEFVRVVRTGGTKPTPVSDGAQLTFEVYARLGSRAIALTEQTRVALAAIAGTVLGSVSVKAVIEVGGPANLPDEIHEELTRYRFTYLVQMRSIASV